MPSRILTGKHYPYSLTFVGTDAHFAALLSSPTCHLRASPPSRLAITRCCRIAAGAVAPIPSNHASSQLVTSPHSRCRRAPIPHSNTCMSIIMSASRECSPRSLCYAVE
ncbi:hypothetical protein BD779DRAFT_1583328 [Infundibulicybe gibba]|nr:hypothetical protein BD779DRAFT_1583328 [Infundibulicybe gibba]